MRRWTIVTVAAAAAAGWLLAAAPAQAQGGDPEAGLWDEGEGSGATQAPPPSGPPPSGPPPSSPPPQQQRRSGGGGGQVPPASGGSSDIRLGMQGRLNVLNLVYGDAGAFGSIVPIATPGLRLADQRLYVGFGVGFASLKVDGPGDDPSAWSLSPLVSYDVVAQDIAALYILGWLNFGDSDTGASVVPDSFFVGLNFGLGVRGKINEALSIGTEWGWGFAKYTDDGVATDFANGFFGTIVFEASIGV